MKTTACLPLAPRILSRLLEPHIANPDPRNAVQGTPRGEHALQESMDELSLSPRRLMTLASLDKVSTDTIHMMLISGERQAIIRPR